MAPFEFVVTIDKLSPAAVEGYQAIDVVDTARPLPAYLSYAIQPQTLP
jgi:hypothetical protein